MISKANFITVEGGEGVGKSLFTSNLARGLRGLRGLALNLVVTREPGGTPTADLIRGLFAKPAPGDPLLMPAESLLVSAARAQHVGRVIRPALDAGQWVLCDRFADSTRVYQGALGGMASGDLEALIRFSTGGLEPDLTFLLDCDVELAQSRLAKRTKTRPDAIERYDQEAKNFHARLREAYLALGIKVGPRLVVLDATVHPDQLAHDALQKVKERFAL